LMLQAESKYDVLSGLKAVILVYLDYANRNKSGIVLTIHTIYWGVRPQRYLHACSVRR